MLLPTELVRHPAWGSFFHNGLEANGVVKTNLYCAPMPAPGTSLDQFPLPSLVSGFATMLQPLKLPATATLLAKGAQTRNPAPPWNGIAPIPCRPLTPIAYAR